MTSLDCFFCGKSTKHEIDKVAVCDHCLLVIKRLFGYFATEEVK